MNNDIYFCYGDKNENRNDNENIRDRTKLRNQFNQPLQCDKYNCSKKYSFDYDEHKYNDYKCNDNATSTKLSEENVKLITKINNLNYKLENQRSEREKLLENINKTDNQCQCTIRKNDELCVKIQSLEKESEIVKEQLSYKSEDCELLEKQLCELIEDKEKNLSLCDDLNKEISNCYNTIDELNDIIRENKQKIYHYEIESADINEKNTSMTDKINMFNDYASELEYKNMELDKSLKENIQKAYQYEIENNNLNEIISSMTDKINMFNEYILRIENENNELRYINDEYTRIRCDNDMLSNKNYQLETECYDLKTINFKQLENITRYTIDEIKLTNKLNSAIQDLNATECKLNKRDEDEFKYIVNEFEMTKKFNDGAMNLRICQDKLDEIKVRFDELDNECKEQKMVIEEYKKLELYDGVYMVNKENNNLKEKFKELIAKDENLKADMRITTHNYDNIISENNKLKYDVSKLSDKNSNYLNEINELKVRCSLISSHLVDNSVF